MLVKLDVYMQISISLQKFQVQVDQRPRHKTDILILTRESSKAHVLSVELICYYSINTASNITSNFFKGNTFNWVILCIFMLRYAMTQHDKTRFACASQIDLALAWSFCLIPVLGFQVCATMRCCCCCFPGTSISHEFQWKSKTYWRHFEIIINCFLV